MVEVLKVKKLTKWAVIPKKAHKDDAGFDIWGKAIPSNILPKWNLTTSSCVVFSTGIAIEIPKGYVGFIKPRSGLSAWGIDILAGVVDSSYRGELLVITNDKVFDIQEIIPKGWALMENLEEVPLVKIAQLVILPVPEFEVEVVEELSDTERGEKGFGSTGK